MDAPEQKPSNLPELPDPHPGARVTLALLRSIMKLSGITTGICLFLGLTVYPLLFIAILNGAILLASFLIAFVVIFFYYARYSLFVLLALIVLFNGLILCVLSGHALLVFLGIIGIGLFCSLLTIRIVGFYPEIETDPPGASAYLLRALSRLQFSLRTFFLTMLWLAVCVWLLSEPTLRLWFWSGIVCALGLVGFLFTAVVWANIAVVPPASSRRVN